MNSNTPPDRFDPDPYDHIETCGGLPDPTHPKRIESLTKLRGRTIKFVTVEIGGFDHHSKLILHFTDDTFVELENFIGPL